MVGPRHVTWIAALALASGGALGCVSNDGFVCAESGDCGSGTCEADGFCSFADGSCESGRRYGEHAGPSSGNCVIAADEATFSARPGTHLGGVIDTVLKSDAPDMAHGTDPALGCLRGSADYVTLYRFDLSALPDGATITTAELDLVVSSQSAGTLDVHDVLEDWSVQAASFRNRGPGTMWRDLGCGAPNSRSANPIGSQAVSSGMFTTALFDLDTDVVQGWVDDEAQNRGVALVCRDTPPGSGVQTASSEGQAERRPLLRVTYSP